MNNDCWKEILMKHGHGPGCIPFPLIFPSDFAFFLGPYLGWCLFVSHALFNILLHYQPLLPPSPPSLHLLLLQCQG